MSESHFRSFRETQLPHRFQKAYTFARDAHQLRTPSQSEAVKPYLFHPVAMAEGAIKAKFGDHLVIAALIHDVVDFTPVAFDHVHSLFDAKVHDLVYDMTCPIAAGSVSDEDYIEAYCRHLNQAHEETKALKLLDLSQTVVALGVSNPYLCARFVQLNQPLLKALHPDYDSNQANSALYLRADYAFKWGTRRAYEKQVEAYRPTLSEAHA